MPVVGFVGVQKWLVGIISLETTQLLYLQTLAVRGFHTSSHEHHPDQLRRSASSFNMSKLTRQRTGCHVSYSPRTRVLV